MSGGGLLSRLLTGPLQELSPLMALSDSTPPLDGLLAQDNGLMSLSPTDSLSMTSILPSLPKGYLSGVAVAGARYASADVIAQVGALNFACPSEETENKERSTTSSPESTDHSARSATSPPERGCTESAQRTEDSPPPPEDQHNDDTHDKKWALLLAAFSVRRAVMFGVFGAGYAAGPGFLLITKLYPTIASPLAAALLDGLIVSPLVFFPCFYLCKELILGRSGTSQGGRAETAAGSVGQVLVPDSEDKTCETKQSSLSSPSSGSTEDGVVVVRSENTPESLSYDDNGDTGGSDSSLDIGGSVSGGSPSRAPALSWKAVSTAFRKWHANLLEDNATNAAIWVPINFVNQSYVPLEWRLVFNHVVGLGWSVGWSVMRGEEQSEEEVLLGVEKETPQQEGDEQKGEAATLLCRRRKLLSLEEVTMAPGAFF